MAAAAARRAGGGRRGRKLLGMEESHWEKTSVGKHVWLVWKVGPFLPRFMSKVSNSKKTFIYIWVSLEDIDTDSRFTFLTLETRRTFPVCMPLPSTVNGQKLLQPELNTSFDTPWWKEIKNVQYNYLDCGQTKITNLDCIIIMQEYIIGFKISMNNILCMEVTEKRDKKPLNSASHPKIGKVYKYRFLPFNKLIGPEFI